MTFVKLTNMVQQLRAGSVDALSSSVTFTDTSGTSRRFTTSSSYAQSAQAENPFFCGSDGSITSPNTDIGKITFCASSATEIPFSTTSVLNEVGTTTSTYTRSSTGWICVIKVVAAEGTKINSLFALRKIYGWSRQDNAVIWALKLDNEVTVDSSGEANFTFSITY